MGVSITKVYQKDLEGHGSMQSIFKRAALSTLIFSVEIGALMTFAQVP
jgi:hypothetical protein